MPHIITRRMQATISGCTTECYVNGTSCSMIVRCNCAVRSAESHCCTAIVGRGLSVGVRTYDANNIWWVWFVFHGCCEHVCNHSFSALKEVSNRCVLYNNDNNSYFDTHTTQGVHAVIKAGIM